MTCHRFRAEGRRHALLVRVYSTCVKSPITKTPLCCCGLRGFVPKKCGGTSLTPEYVVCRGVFTCGKSEKRCHHRSILFIISLVEFLWVKGYIAFGKGTPMASNDKQEHVSGPPRGRTSLSSCWTSELEQRRYTTTPEVSKSALSYGTVVHPMMFHHCVPPLYVMETPNALQRSTYRSPNLPTPGDNITL